MITKTITYFSKPAVIACDAKCEKAWGMNGRERIQLSDDEDDYAYLADDELGIAPVVGSEDDEYGWSGGITKPSHNGDLLNKWCCRACERCCFVVPGEEVLLHDFSMRVYNMPKD